MREGTPISLEAPKASINRQPSQCTATTKAGSPCKAPAVERGLCYFHAHPDRLRELGRQGGKANRRFPKDPDLPEVQLRSVNDVTALLAQTINQVRSGGLDPRTGNAVGYLAAVMLKALQQGDIEARLQALEAVHKTRALLGRGA